MELGGLLRGRSDSLAVTSGISWLENLLVGVVVYQTQGGMWAEGSLGTGCVSTAGWTACLARGLGPCG